MLIQQKQIHLKNHYGNPTCTLSLKKSLLSKYVKTLRSSLSDALRDAKTSTKALDDLNTSYLQITDIEQAYRLQLKEIKAVIAVLKGDDFDLEVEETTQPIELVLEIKSELDAFTDIAPDLKSAVDSLLEHLEKAEYELSLELEKLTPSKKAARKTLQAITSKLCATGTMDYRHFDDLQGLPSDWAISVKGFKFPSPEQGLPITATGSAWIDPSDINQVGAEFLHRVTKYYRGKDVAEKKAHQQRMAKSLEESERLNVIAELEAVL